MGNFKDLEKEFIERTLRLIFQYEKNMYKYEFSEQFNYTLLINCLLGLIIMPKEKTISFIPKHRLTNDFKKEIGLEITQINPEILDLKDLIIALRNSVAHFDLSVQSIDSNFLIDEIVFKDSKISKDYEIIRFKSNELLPFMQYYASWVLKNYQHRS